MCPSIYLTSNENLKDIYMPSLTIVSILSYYNFCNFIENIYVPQTLLEDYRAGTAREEYKNLFKPLPDDWQMNV